MKDILLHKEKDSDNHKKDAFHIVYRMAVDRKEHHMVSGISLDEDIPKDNSSGKEYKAPNTSCCNHVVYDHRQLYKTLCTPHSPSLENKRCLHIRKLITFMTNFSTLMST